MQSKEDSKLAALAKFSPPQKKEKEPEQKKEPEPKKEPEKKKEKVADVVTEILGRPKSNL